MELLASIPGDGQHQTFRKSRLTFHRILSQPLKRYEMGLLNNIPPHFESSLVRIRNLLQIRRSPMAAQTKTITSVIEQGMNVIKQAQDASTEAFNSFTSFAQENLPEILGEIREKYQFNASSASAQKCLKSWRRNSRRSSNSQYSCDGEQYGQHLDRRAYERQTLIHTASASPGFHLHARPQPR